MGTGIPGGAVAGYLRAALAMSTSRLARARRDRELGASAIELAIITAVLVGLAVTVLVIINTVVTSRANQISSNNGQIP
jgi:Flp pilus assembly protein TadG